MPNYDFNKDLPIARKTEREIASLIEKHYNAKVIAYGHGSAYDIKAVVNGKTFTFEVKEDFTCERTNNVGVEYASWGRPAGISVSKADYYVYKIHTRWGIKIFIFKTQAIKNMIAREEYHRIVNGGDTGSNSMNYLFAFDVFTSHGKDISP